MFSPKTRILVVDDFTSMRKVTIQVLQQLGFSNFIEAGEGNIAWNVLINVKPTVELVICDWNMPNCSGIDLLKKMKADERFQHLPFIMSTTRNEKAHVLEALKFGADNFIIKPFTLEVIEKKMEQLWQKTNQP